MAMSVDDLEYNTFFKVFQTKFKAKYEEAQKKQWLMCIPTEKSLLSEENITKEFVDLHILKPSPFFKSHFVTTDVNSSKSYEIDDAVIKMENGEIKIIMEETAYNEDYKPFRILILERPLSYFPNYRRDSHCSSKAKKLLLSLSECTDFLHTSTENSDVLQTLSKKISSFKASYVVLPRYLLDASEKLRRISQWGSKELLQAVKPESVDEQMKSDVLSAVENYIMCQVHTKVFPVVKKQCFEEDERLMQKLRSLYEANVTPDQLGVGESFCCQTPGAIVELASLNSKSCPAQKLHCLKTTLELLNQDVEHFLSETHSPINKDRPHITSDDLIPLLVALIIQARPQYLASNLYYIQNFCWEISSVDQFSFSLVTFQAAKEFLNNSSFEFLKPSIRKMKKELSLKELMEVTVEIQNSSRSSNTRLSQCQSPIDHQLENVTKLIEASTTELREKSGVRDATNTKINAVQITQSEDNLGSFLSGLRNSSLGLGYGKQA